MDFALALGPAVAGAAFTALLMGLAWLIRRRMTPETARERYELADKVLDVRSKLSAAGYCDEEVEHFISTLESDKTGEKLTSAFKSIGSGSVITNESEEPAILQTTAAMGARIDARLKVLDAEIERVLLDIEIVTSHNFDKSEGSPNSYDRDHVRKMHRAWKVYRKRAAHSASEDYVGGSISGVIWLLEEVRIAETFLKDMTERLKQLSQ